MAYCKIHLYAQLLESDLPEDPYLGPRPRALLPAAAARALRRRRCARTGCAARSSRPSSPTSSSTARARRSSSGCGEETGAPAVDTRARVRGRARGVRDALVLGRGRGARQPGRSRDPADDADRGPAPGRARDALAGAREPAPDRHRADDRALRAGRQAHGAGAARRARRRRSRGVRRARRATCADGGVPAELADRVGRRCRRCISVFDIVEVAAASGRDQDDGDDGLRPARLPARAQLAARPDHRAAAHQPLAGAGARCAARRPLQRAPIADPGGARGGRGSARRRGGDRRLGRAQRGRRRALHGDPGGHQRLAGVRHDDAAGGAARGAQPDPRRRRGGWGRFAAQRARPGRVRRRSRQDQGRSRTERIERTATRPGSAHRSPPAPNSPPARDHSDAVTNTSTSTTPATKKASGPGHHPRLQVAKAQRQAIVP